MRILSPLLRTTFSSPNQNLLTVNQASVESDLTGFTANRVSISKSPTIAKFGSSSLLMTPLGTGADAYAAIGGDTGAMRLGMVAGNTYTISGYVYVPETNGVMGSSVRIVFYYYDSLKSAYVGASSNVNTIVDQWEYMKLTVTLPSTVTEALVRLYNSSNDTSKSVYWDGLQLEQNDHATAWRLPDYNFFTRNSLAYDSLGRIAEKNLPRLEYVDGVGWVTAVEEATTNLITNQNFTTGWTTLHFIKMYLGDGWYRFTCTSDIENRAIYYRMSSSALTYTGAIEVRNNAQPVKLCLLSTSDYVPNEYKVIPANSRGRHYVTGTQDDASDTMYFYIYVNSGNANSSGMSFEVRFPQLEQKAYPTSWTDSSRAAELLILPTTGLSVSEGTIEGIVEITDVAKRQATNQYPRIFHLSGSVENAAIYIRQSPDAASMNLVTNDSTEYASVTFNNTLLPSGKWYYYKVYWTNTLAKLEFWDLQTKTKVVDVSINNPKLPSAFAADMFLGRDIGSTNFLNTRFGKHRLSSVARTDDPDFDDLMPDDDDTVLIFDPTPNYNHLT